MSYLGQALHGDLGRSYVQDEAVLPAIVSHLPQTIELALAGLVAELLIAFALGTLAARAAGSIAGCWRCAHYPIV